MIVNLQEYEPQKPWDVSFMGKIFDTVFFPESLSEEEVTRRLIEDQSYDPGFTVEPRGDYDERYEVRMALWVASADKSLSISDLRAALASFHEALAQETVK